MPSEKFCHLCGEKVIVASRRLPFRRTRCPACKRKVGRGALLPVLLFALALAAGFVAGRATSPRRGLYFIGVPADPLTGQRLPAEETAAGQSIDHLKADTERKPAALAEGSESEEARGTLCGAPTKRGRPCRRRVRGGGYCWQHKK